jgi:hypoxanthine-guanine phosphoribosyltransferase
MCCLRYENVKRILMKNEWGDSQKRSLKCVGFEVDFGFILGYGLNISSNAKANSVKQGQ